MVGVLFLDGQLILINRRILWMHAHHLELIRKLLSSLIGFLWVEGVSFRELPILFLLWRQLLLLLRHLIFRYS